MNQALNTMHQISRAPFGVRSLVAAAVAAGALFGASLACAAAEPPNQRRDEAAQSQRGNDNRAEQRGEQRDGRAEEQRRAMQERAEASRRNGRLTPDERRDLRRQINEAGQDIYSNQPRR